MNDRLVVPAIQNLAGQMEKRIWNVGSDQLINNRASPSTRNRMKNNGDTTSSPPTTPPSPPLPISVGPGCQKYDFSSSCPSLLPSTPLTSSEILPLLTLPLPTSPAFSMDLQLPQAPPQHNTSSCIKDLLEWLVLRCCRNCSLPI